MKRTIALGLLSALLAIGLFAPPAQARVDSRVVGCYGAMVNKSLAWGETRNYRYYSLSRVPHGAEARFVVTTTYAHCPNVRNRGISRSKAMPLSVTLTAFHYHQVPYAYQGVRFQVKFQDNAKRGKWREYTLITQTDDALVNDTYTWELAGEPNGLKWLRYDLEAVVKARYQIMLGYPPQDDTDWVRLRVAGFGERRFNPYPPNGDPDVGPPYGGRLVAA